MKRMRSAGWVATGLFGLACNAVLGLEEVTKLPPPDDNAGRSGSGGASAGSGGSAGKASGGTAGSSGNVAGAGGDGSAGDAGNAGNAGESGAGGGSERECTPDETRPCRELDPNLLGNCGAGTVRCGRDGTWGACNVTRAEEDDCDTEGDDADCDGTTNGGCPCVTGDTKPCGPETEDGICEFGVSQCEGEVWQACEGATLPGARDCRSSADNDCDGEPDNVIDDVCPCASDGEHRCVGDAPADWLGPIALATAAGSAAAPSCTATGYERAVLSKFGGIDEGDVNCGCTCSAPGNMTCTGTPGLHRVTSSVNCVQIGLQVNDPVEYNVPANTCVNVQSGRLKAVGRSFSSSGSCTPQPTNDIDDAVFRRRMVACETNDASTAGCAAAELCVPNLVAPLEKFCIYREGEHECPTGTPYGARTVYYDELDDGRSCSTCTCGSATGTCQGAIQLTDNPNATCVGEILVAELGYGACTDTNTTLIAISGPSTPVGSCAPSGGQLQGSVARNGPTTVCCEP